VGVKRKRALEGGDGFRTTIGAFVRDAQVVVRRRIARVERDRAVEVLDRILGPIGLDERVSEIVVRVRLLGRERDELPKARDRERKVAVLQRDHGGIVERTEIVRKRRKIRRVSRLGVSQPARLLQLKSAGELLS